MTRGATQQAIEHHYDVGNSFYELWLGQTMAYSGALWGEGDDLDAAQVRKFDHHIRESGADRARRVLDIGCGWGGVLNRVHGLRRDAEAPEALVGLTLSSAQAEWVRRMEIPRTEIRVESWADYRPAEKFQAIVSVGAFEHFARIDFTEAQKTAAYREFFERCHALLDEGGHLSLQTFAYGSVRSRSQALTQEATQFLSEEIFRETDPPSLVNIAEAIQGTFELVRMHNDREGYARTCREWLERLKAQKAEAIARSSAETYERYRKYLFFSYAGFMSGNMDLYRITLRRLPSRGGA